MQSLPALTSWNVSVMVVRGNRAAFDPADQDALGHAPAGVAGVELFFEVVNDFKKDIHAKALGGLGDVNRKGKFHSSGIDPWAS